MTARTWAVVIAGLATLAGAAAPSAAAQDPNPEQMKRMYDDAVTQLKAAQERKNQLAAENDRLQKQAAEAQKELAAATAKLDELRRADADHAERTFFLRSHYVAWQQFTKDQPELLDKWRAFIKSDYYAAPLTAADLKDKYWPLGVPAPAPVANPSTRPATGPATVPATLPATGPATHPATEPTPPATAPATAPVTPAPAIPAPAVPPASQPAATAPATKPA